jgi:hypothetical protein
LLEVAALQLLFQLLVLVACRGHLQLALDLAILLTRFPVFLECVYRRLLDLCHILRAVDLNPVIGGGVIDA